MAWEKSRKVEFGRVGRKCKGHWVNGVEKPIKKQNKKTNHLHNKRKQKNHIKQDVGVRRGSREWRGVERKVELGRKEEKVSGTGWMG